VIHIRRALEIEIDRAKVRTYLRAKYLVVCLLPFASLRLHVWVRRRQLKQRVERRSPALKPLSWHQAFGLAFGGPVLIGATLYLAVSHRRAAR